MVWCVCVCVQDLSSGEKLEIKLSGMLSYSDDQRLLFCQTANVAKGGNAIATLILLKLKHIKTSGTPAAAARTLHLQVDGGSENINKYAINASFTQADELSDCLGRCSV